MTALGSPVVLGLVVLIITGYLLLRGALRHRDHRAGDVDLRRNPERALKLLFERPRPAVVPHLRTVVTASFPSGHAMESAIIYLTLGAC